MIKEIIRKAKDENKKVYIYAHKFPDGDAIGSSLAIAEYLKDNGIDAKYILSQESRLLPEIFDEISVTTSVDRNQISLILDTNKTEQVDNRNFMKSRRNDIYVIDHHQKTENSIEEELKLSSDNVIRDSKASSTCELILNQIDREKITPQIANYLTTGLLTDTAKLKFLRENTLHNLAVLIASGARYDEISEICNKKIKLKDEVVLARLMLKVQKYQIGDTFGLILPVNFEEANRLEKQYYMKNLHRKIFKMSDIENCSFNCMSVETEPGNYNIEFRSATLFGNFDVFNLALQLGGGGHHNASGCSLTQDNGFEQNGIIEMIKQTTQERYSNYGKGIKKIELNNADKELSSILEKTQNLTKNVTPQALSQVHKLIKSGANYEYIFRKMKTFEEFMLGNEILSRVTEDVLNEKNPVVKIILSEDEIEILKHKYNINEKTILENIRIFSNIDIENASIELPDGSKSIITKTGKVEILKSKDEDEFSL